MGAAAVADPPVAVLPWLPRTWPVRHGGWLALAGFALLLLLTALLIRGEGARIGLELDAATLEGHGLKMRQEILRGQLFELARQLDDTAGGKSSFPMATGGGRGLVPNRARP